MSQRVYGRLRQEISKIWRVSLYWTSGLGFDGLVFWNLLSQENQKGVESTLHRKRAEGEKELEALVVASRSLEGLWVAKCALAQESVLESGFGSMMSRLWPLERVALTEVSVGAVTEVPKEVLMVVAREVVIEVVMEAVMEVQTVVEKGAQTEAWMEAWMAVDETAFLEYPRLSEQMETSTSTFRSTSWAWTGTLTTETQEENSVLIWDLQSLN